MKVIQEVKVICFEQIVWNPKWENAVDEKMVAFNTDAIWKLVTLPKEKKGGVYKVKHNVDIFINKYKTMLVTKGYIQTYNINYEKTYNLVVKITIVKIVILTKNWQQYN